MFDEELDDGLLAGQTGDVKCRVSFLSGCVHECISLEQLLDHAHVSFLAGQVQSVETVLLNHQTNRSISTLSLLDVLGPAGDLPSC